MKWQRGESLVRRVLCAVSHLAHQGQTRVPGEARGVVLAAMLATVANAQSVWQLRGGDAAVRIVGEQVITMTGPRDHKLGLDPGDYTVHFGIDAAGKPGSLTFAVPADAVVHLASEPAAAAAARRFDLAHGTWHEEAGVDTVRTIGPLDAADYHVACVAEPTAATTLFGLVARFRSGDEFYAFLVEPGRGEVRLERRLGPTPLVLARAPLPRAPAGLRHLALQVQGFRLHAFVDGQSVLQVFDGGITRGASGICWRGAAPAWSEFTTSPPAAPRASAVLVRTANHGRNGTATVRAVTTVSPGHWHVLQLALDRPHPLVPTDADGFEPWLLQRPAAPVVLGADWRGATGENGIGEVPRDGLVASTVQWAALPALRLQVALVRMILVTSDGDAIAGTTPPLPLVF